MTVTSYLSGTQTATGGGTEDFLVSPNVIGKYAIEIDLNAMVAGDVVEFRVYAITITGGTARQVWYDMRSGVQEVFRKDIYSPWISNVLTDTNSLRFSLTQTKGTGRAFPWNVHQENNSANVATINSVSTSSVTTVNANQGTTQPENFTGTGASALVKVDTVDIAGTASAGAAGYVGVDWGHVNAPTTTVALSGTTVGVVTTTTTATNLTNAPSAGDFTATMKTSLNAATPASITGAVASVTGNVGGNVTGSVGSVVGAVGSVTGAVGSVTGAVGSVIGLTNTTITDAVWDETLASHLSAGSTGAALNTASSGGSVPTVQQIVDGVWNEANSSHVISGSTGANLANTLAQVLLLTSGGYTIALQSSFTQTGDLVVTQGQDNLLAIGTQIQVTVTGLTVSPAGGVFSIVVYNKPTGAISTTILGTLLSYSAGTAVIYWEHTAAQNSAFNPPNAGTSAGYFNYGFALEIAYPASAGTVIPIPVRSGTFTVNYNP